MSNTNRHPDHNPMGLTKKITIITISNNPPMESSNTTQTHIQTVRVTLPQFVSTEATPIYLESQTIGGTVIPTSQRMQHKPQVDRIITLATKMMLLKRVQQLEDQAEQQNTPPKTNTSNINNGTTKNTNSAQSNVLGAPLQIQDMLEYITNTMETLNGFKTQLTQLEDTGQTHS